MAPHPPRAASGGGVVLTGAELCQAYLAKARLRMEVLELLTARQGWSDLVLLAELERFPPEAHGRLAALAEHSQWLRAQRELAFYGDVEWIPTERYGPMEGERALAAARDALDLAESFRTLPIYSSVREGHWEQFLSFRFGSIRLNGSADLIGDDFILDIKTDQEIDPQEHRFQIWAYAKAAKKSQAYIAYLRHKQLVPFSKEDLQTISQEAEELIMAIKNKNFMPMPSQKVCPYCPYGDICDQVFASATTEKTDE